MTQMTKSELIARLAARNPHLYQRDVERIVATVYAMLSHGSHQMEPLAVPFDRKRVVPGASTNGIIRSAEPSRTDYALAHEVPVPWPVPAVHPAGRADRGQQQPGCGTRPVAA